MLWSFFLGLTMFIKIESRIIISYFNINIFKLSNPKMVLAPSFAWRELFSSDKRHERLYFFPGWEKWVIISHFEKPIWPPNGNENRNREYVIENLPHEAPGAPKIFGFESLNIFTYHVSNITVTALTPYLVNQRDSLSRHLWKLWFHSMHLFVILDRNQTIWFIWMFFISGKIWEFIFVNIRSGFSLSFFRMSEADPGLFPLSDWTQRHKLIHSSKMMKNASKHRKRHGRIYYSYWYV